MNIPPFPSQDLAKLVLGYLAEEQLMTAYDEFLQASPYLDALENEYDRIFMTSLKSILAEYRAVKIYVETCKPYSLRRRLFGCTNLLEMVKFLIENVDISNINRTQDGTRGRLEHHSVAEKSPACAVCSSLTLASCACKSRLASTPNHLANIAESSSLENSVETTPLTDLPGNHGTARKKQVKVLLEDTRVSQSTLSCNTNRDASLESLNVKCYDPSTINNTPILNNTKSHESTQPVESCQTPHLVTRMNEIQSVVTCNNRVIPHRISTANSFQSFSPGIIDSNNLITDVPDSSTLEHANTQIPLTQNCDISGTKKEPNIIGSNLRKVPKSQIFLTVGTIKSTVNSTELLNHPSFSKPKLPDQKVTILSDVKVDKTFPPESSNMPPVLKNAANMSLVQMQTILINGRPVYRQSPQMTVNRTFTKDEIMAMPTIIVVTTSGSSQIPPNFKPQTTLCQATNTPIVTTCTQSLEPLVIDVSSDSPTLEKESEDSTVQQDKEKEMLIKTVDYKNASAPKDGTEVSNKNTPQVLPPVRKSSSTPRRTSHVRVLDFATPRRILEDAITEQSECIKTSVDVVISQSPNLYTLANPSEGREEMSRDCDKRSKPNSSKAYNSGSSKENDNSVNPALGKKSNWDADLRALAITNRKEDIPESRIKPRCRPRPKGVKKNEKKENKSEGKLKNKSNEKTHKNRSSKSKRKSEEIIEEPVIVMKETASIHVKPTINIITGSDWNSLQETEKNQNKSGDIDPVDTPEMDRISLQNAIGAKLNISDLLETPYKQALYDIQMETPRFLGPDIPGEPLSDIKIMNIPTPRFLATPKPVQATPSSYSSRPTDYSSGGSYYKPDDQDYLSVGDLGYPSSTSKDKANTDTPVSENLNNKTNGGKSSRPVRSCAKNVSYYNSPLINKTKDTDDKSEVTLPCSETANAENNVKESKAKTPKSGARKRNSTVKKRKTPVKKDKSFIKIKPRRISPIKKRTPEGPRRKRTNSKDRNINETPLVIPAPTKSRRKSSTPRKLHCTKSFNSDKYGNESPEMISKTNRNDNKKLSPGIQDSDTEQIPLRWSDDGSQDVKTNKPQVQEASTSVNDAEDISTIKEYIASELPQRHNTDAPMHSNDQVSNLHVDLVKRGFDEETAKIIERDLLDTRPDLNENLTTAKSVCESENAKPCAEVLQQSIESDTSSNLKIIQDEEDDFDEIEFSVAECGEDSENFIRCHHDDTKDVPVGPLIKLKDKFSVEVCIDDDVAIRLRATPFSLLVDEDPQAIDAEEIQMAVNSISNIDKLYTPLKESIRAQVYDIFDSTLTSLDTPLKATTPRRKECDTTVTEIVLEVEEIVDKEINLGQKRKRLPSNESDAPSESKRTKPEAQYLLNSANIQNIDIETVLSKLHGP